MLSNQKFWFAVTIGVVCSILANKTTINQALAGFLCKQGESMDCELELLFFYE